MIGQLLVPIFDKKWDARANSRDQAIESRRKWVSVELMESRKDIKARDWLVGGPSLPGSHGAWYAVTYCSDAQTSRDK